MELLQTLSTIFASVVAGVLLVLTPLLSLVSGAVSTPAIHIAPLLEQHATSTAQSPALSATTSVTSTSTKKTAAPAPSKGAVSISASSITPPVKAPATTTPAIDPTLLNTQTRAGLVNILCLTNTSLVHPISASGVFVDSRGVILTNAHVGQFFLLNDFPSPGSVNCVVRTGSPAMPAYYATLLYLPPAWIQANASQIVAQEALGTGENDYAFLLVTGAVGSTPLPVSFPALPMTNVEPTLGDQTLLAAYPAGFLDGQTIVKSLYIASAYAAVKELFTFGTGRDIDLISIGGTVVSQGGSSGGAVVRTDSGDLEAIIATDTSADTTAQRDLRAITLAHVNRSLIKYGQGGIVSFLSQDLTKEALLFASSIAPAEKAALVSAIEKH